MGTVLRPYAGFCKPLTTLRLMKLSKLKAAIDKALEAYGDMEVGVYDEDYCNSIAKEDMGRIRFRVLTEDEGEGRGLPGESFDKEDSNQSSKETKYAVIFYQC